MGGLIIKNSYYYYYYYYYYQGGSDDASEGDEYNTDNDSGESLCQRTIIIIVI